MRLFLVVPVTLALAGCADLYGTTHCDFRETEKPPRCQQRDGAMGGAFQALCDQTKGKSGDGACPTENVVAGCRGAVNPAQSVTDWYYLHDTMDTDRLVTKADVEVKCADEDAELVDP